ncbi:MAG: hypothetical protein QM286_04805 [Acidobacteriota bacterium]|nr:hypothetical protein [Acidobacteriota bacterium]
MRAATEPVDVLPVLKQLVDETLQVADVRNYRQAAVLLTQLRHASDAAGTLADFDAYLADVVDANRRRTRIDP